MSRVESIPESIPTLVTPIGLETIQWTTLQPIWTAEYSKATDSWNVDMEFEVDAARKAIEWIVNDKSGAVTEKPRNK